MTTVDEHTQKVMSYPAGQLDWIGGFSVNSRGSVQFETYLTPVLRCYTGYRHSWSKIPICEAITRTKSSAVLHTVPPRILARIHPGGIYVLRKLLAELPGINEAKLLGQQCQQALTPQDLVFNLDDNQSIAAPFRDIKRDYPEIANLICQWRSSCPDSVSFFIATNDAKTIIIPTIEILRTCYFPDRITLERFLNSPERATFLSRYVGFDGSRYVAASGDEARFYPVRARRFIERAEQEISQLLPRASAYHQRYGGILPILIRPPFSGPVRISAPSLARTAKAGDQILFFPHGVDFAPVARIRKDSNRTRVMQFAPVLRQRGVSLTEIGGTAEWSEPDNWFAVHDVGLFDRMARAVIRGIEDRTYNSPIEDLFKDNDFGSFRAWLLWRGRV